MFRVPTAVPLGRLLLEFRLAQLLHVVARYEVAHHIIHLVLRYVAACVSLRLLVHCWALAQHCSTVIGWWDDSLDSHGAPHVLFCERVCVLGALESELIGLH